MTVIRAAAVQLSPVLYSREKTVEKIVGKIAELRSHKVQFATFPEAIVPYYPYFTFLQPPFKLAAEHLRLMDQAVTIPRLQPTHSVRQLGRRHRGLHRRQRKRRWQPVQHPVAVRRRRHAHPAQAKDHADLSRTHPLGAGRREGPDRRRQRLGRIGQLACWEHCNPLARYALIADGEQIHAAMFPGSFGGQLFSEQAEISVRNHALESGAFVVNATGWLDPDQQAQIVADTGGPIEAISHGSFTAIISPQGELLGEPLRSGEGEVIADLDFAMIDARKSKMDSAGHYGRPELLSLLINRTPTAYLHNAGEVVHAIV